VGDEAELSVSELVTNAVLHTASDVRLTLRREGAAGVWIGVQDDSDRMPQRTEAADDDIAGRGLAIVELVADAWGVDAAPGGAGKTVWLTLSAG
jgi:two-component sensor histidine kinase